MDDCLFCEIYKEGKEVISENEHFYARFDLVPISPGHVEVIPKRHVVSLADLTAEEWNLLRPAIVSAIGVIESTDLRERYETLAANPPFEKSGWYSEQMLNHPSLGKKPDAYNHGINDGEAAGRTIHHLHWHIVPRFEGDVEDPRGGVRYIFPELANYKK